MWNRLTCLAAAACCAVPAVAGVPQCSYTTSLLNAWDAAAPPEAGQMQSPFNGWTFRRSDQGRALLVGIPLTGYPAGSWGSPDQPFGIPLVGPRYSPVAGRNQVLNYRRPPSFEGLFFHPGYTPIDVIAELKPQATEIVSGLTVQTEHLGQASPDYVVTARIERAGGSVVLIPPTHVNSLAAAVTLTAAANLFPQMLAPADRLVIVGNNGGSPFEDWVNLNATVRLAGPPVITTQPDATSSCIRGEATLHVAAAGATSYFWQKDGSDVEGGNGPTLTLTNITVLDDGLYTCLVGNECGMVESTPVRVSICPGDYNCDGGIDGADVDAFFADWEAGNEGADVNADGGIDGSDVDFFFMHWEGGC